MSSKRSIPDRVNKQSSSKYLEPQSSMKQLPVIEEYLEQQPPPPPLATLIEQSPSPPPQKRLRKSTSVKDFFANNRNSQAEALRLSRISEELFSKGSAVDNNQGLESAALSFPNKPEESFVPPPLANESMFPKEAASIKSEKKLSEKGINRQNNSIAKLLTKEEHDLIDQTAASLKDNTEYLKQKDDRVGALFKHYIGVYKPDFDREAKNNLIKKNWAEDGENYRADDFGLYGSRELDKIAFEKYKNSVKDKLTEYELKELEAKVLGVKSATETEFEKVTEANIGLQTKAKLINFVGVVLGGLSGAAVIPVVPFLAPVMGGAVVILFFCNTLAEKYKSKLSLRNLVNDLSNICLRIYQTIDNINKSISNEDESTKLAFNDVSTLADLNNSLRDVYVYIMSLLDEPELQIMSSSYDNKKKEEEGLTDTELFILNLIDDEIKIRRGGSQMNRAKRAIGFRIFNSSDFTLRITTLMTKLNSNLILYYNNFLAKGIMDNKVIIKFNELQNKTSQENKSKQENNSPINLMTSAINITPGMVRDFRARRNELVDNINIHTSGIARSMFEGYTKYGVNPFKKTVQSIRSTFKWGKGGNKHRITKKQRQKGMKTYKRKPKNVNRTVRK